MFVDDYAFETEFHACRRTNQGRLCVLVVSGAGQAQGEGGRDEQDGQAFRASRARRKNRHRKDCRQPGRCRAPPGGCGHASEKRAAGAGDQGAWPQPRPV